MAETVERRQAAVAGRRTGGSLAWFAWMEAMWGAFFAPLVVGQLDEVWNWVRDLPLVGQIVAWVVAFPWRLGTAVWGSDWATWARVLLVIVFALLWSSVSVPAGRVSGSQGEPDTSMAMSTAAGGLARSAAHARLAARAFSSARYAPCSLACSSARGQLTPRRSPGRGRRACPNLTRRRQGLRRRSPHPVSL
jgi:hypothetical protein